ncbi:hypothetical protein [Nocardia transvalensis]|uniref:TPR repeat region-containing protein n=1 Tax=Nocardia transvalensis TaxID=37333 RepID=UPI001894BC16|nr:hypothetical protein [Nocardia transvalensis]
MIEHVTTTGSADKTAVHDLLTGRGLRDGASTDQVLDRLMHRHWDDGGAAVGTMFSWIETDAKATDSAAAVRAGESATGLARYLGSHAAELLNLDGPRTRSVGQVNPRAVEGIATALTPYIANFAGVTAAGLGATAFTPPDGENSARHNAINVFAVVVSNKDSAGHFARATFSVATRIASTWVSSELDRQPKPASAYEYGVLCRILDRGLAAEAEDRSQDKFGDPLPADPAKYEKPYVDYRRTGFQLPGLDLVKALQDRDGIVEHDPRYDYLFGPDGRLKDIIALIDRNEINFAEAKGDLANILNSYHGRVMELPALRFYSEYRDGWDSVK